MFFTKSIVLLIACVIAALASAHAVGSLQNEDPPVHLYKRHNPPNPAQNSTCRLEHAGATFKFWVDDLTITGEILGDASLDQSILLDIDVGGASLLQFSAELTFAGPICCKWHFGDMIGTVKDMTLTTNGNWTTGTVNGHGITPFSPQSSSLTFTDGTLVPAPVIPAHLIPALAKVPDALQQVIDNCPSPDDSTLLIRQTTPFPRFIDSLACVRCTLSVSDGLLIGGLRCGLQIPDPENPTPPPMPCGSIPGPIAILQCTRVRFDNFGSPCCPVTCGSSETGFGFGFRRPSRCCGSDEVCVLGSCCPADQVRRGICCLTLPDACCAPGTPPRCISDGFQTCVDGFWVFTPCTPPRICDPAFAGSCRLRRLG